MKKILELLNSKRDIITYYNVPYEFIKRDILGFSSRLMIITDSYYKSPKATIYIFTSEQLKTDEKLCAILFGRKNAYGFFQATETQIQYLCENYAYDKNGKQLFFDTIDKKEITEVENSGREVEVYLCEKYGFKKASEKMDNSQKIDIFSNIRIQVKCSIIKNERSHGKGSKTNGHLKI